MKKYIFIIISFIFLAACESDIDRMIFLPDENDANLPAYTEWGYNTFGAKYEKEYFVSSNEFVPCKIIRRGEQLQFVLIGEKHYSKMNLSVTFPFHGIQKYQDLVALNGLKLDLTNCDVSITFGENEPTPLSVISGELYFKRVQVLRIDEVENRALLSGTFSLQFWKNDLPETISDGRFDVGINDELY